MKKLLSHAISGLLICLLLGSSLGNVQGSNKTFIQESDPLAGTKYDKPLVSATSISAGSGHSCAVTTEGGVKCWGENWSGQLGDGTKDDSVTPVDVDGLTSGVIAVSAGSGYTCAVTSAGGLKCWGSNNFGRLGNDTTNSSSIPVDVIGLSSGVISVSTGILHTCAVTSTGGVKCWGNNYYGRLGDGTTDDSLTPVDVDGLESVVVVEVSVGESHTCALTSEGEVMCWGNNGEGQLGIDPATTTSNIPVPVSGLTSGVKAVSVGVYHTCAVTSAGGVKCWGDNTDGQLGDDSIESSSTPVAVDGLISGVIDVSSGDLHNCALTSAGEVKCWGDNDYGQLGDGTTDSRSTPVEVRELTGGVKEVSAGRFHTCVLTSGGGVRCWGGNEDGQLGDGTTTRVTTPVDVYGLSSGVSQVSAGENYSCALTSGNGVKCWGDKYYALYDPDGDFTDTSTSIPVDVDELTSGVKAVSSGKYHTCAITEADGVKCWGNNNFGQLGNGTTNSLTPVNVIGLTGAVSVSVGDDHTCALTSDGVKCWGSNAFDQLGYETTTTCDGTPCSSTPVNVSELASGVEAISAGANHTCAITQTGGIKCWGYNQLGQLGTVTPYCDFFYCSKTPVDVDGLTSGVKDVSAGGNHTCAITKNNGVMCWGLNENGQLGDGYTSENFNSTPDFVVGFTDEGEDAIDVSAGYQHTCAITLSGTLKCWGDNYFGQLGDGTTNTRRTPVSVDSLTSGVKAVSAGTGHTCAITSADGVKCWGGNEHGQVGWKVLWVPVDVIGFVENFMLFLPLTVR